MNERQWKPGGRVLIEIPGLRGERPAARMATLYRLAPAGLAWYVKVDGYPGKGWTHSCSKYLFREPTVLDKLADILAEEAR